MAPGKLTTIVAIDIYGYSARSQADEAGAIASVKRLNERCEKAAAEHGGRVFSRAGDAVLLEFSSVSGGLAAAEELAADPDPPIRVGVHLGEVSEMPNGDLLGHGVNVAARLQSQAPVGGVLVSEDARRAVRGPIAERLAAKGVIKLDKIDESIGVFELSAQAQPHARVDARHRTRRWTRWGMFGGAALLALAAVAFVASQVTAPPTTRVAVFSLAAGDNAELQALAAGVADDMALALTARDVETVGRAEMAGVTREERIERARQLGAEIAVDGSAEQLGDSVRLTVAILQISDRTTLWSQAFEGESSALLGLRMRAAERSADVLSCGVDVLRMRGRRMETETFSRFLRACGMQRDNMRMVETRDTMAAVVEREPNFAYARALLSLSASIASDGAPDGMREDLLREARDQAERAIRIDPSSSGHAYVTLFTLLPLSEWSSRERLLQEGIEHDPLNSVVHNNYGSLLYQAGRVREGLAYVQRGSALDPLSPIKRRNLAYALHLSGDFAGARAIAAAMAPAYPDEPRVWRALFRATFWGGDYDEALRMIAASPTQSRLLPCWREAASALRGTAPAARAARRIRACREEGFDDEHALVLLAALGDLDGAFAIVQSVLDEDEQIFEIVFLPQAAPVRADPRFMPLMHDAGLLQYWRESGHWPDFCAEPSLPYRCEAEAARLL